MGDKRSSLHSYGHGWSGTTATAVEERKPYRGPGRRFVAPQRTVHAGRVNVDPPMVRTPDHDTSIEGAEAASETKENLQRKLLVVWHAAGPKGFTDEEAAEAAGLLDTCHWKRAGELRAKGLIAYNGEKRKGRKGVSRKVSVFVTED